jgi:hypothetical protein
MLELFYNVAIIAAGTAAAGALMKLIFKKSAREIFWACIDSLF